ncbi:MAG: hypothetical protein BWY95_02335 [Bacteroidetes bacterium ADurb.BinA104]|nr:MAG: hypothetical protein BWY95_02335 [Bacteroidetes bacterium ADurb.BinA104]
MSRSVIGHIEIVGLCLILAAQSIYLLYIGYNTHVLAHVTNCQHTLLRTHTLFNPYGTGNLEIGKSETFGLTKKLFRQSL